jgi:HPt (histidine-containing phosphotransfer) domain-containing protein
MIDKRKFSEMCGDLGSEFIIDLIDLYVQRHEALILSLATNLAAHDLVQVELNAHELKGVCLNFHDPVASEDARRMEEASKRKIVEIVDAVLAEFPEALHEVKQQMDERDLVYKVIFVDRSIKAFLTDVLGSLSDEGATQLQKLERNKVEDGMHQMFLDLKSSTTILLEELLKMKKELSSN